MTLADRGYDCQEEALSGIYAALTNGERISSTQLRIGSVARNLSELIMAGMRPRLLRVILCSTRLPGSQALVET